MMGGVDEMEERCKRRKTGDSEIKWQRESGGMEGRVEG